MPSAAELAVWVGILLLFGFAGIILWKVATGGICLDYLLDGDARVANGAGYSTFFSPGRAQMLAFTVIFAANYLLQVIQDPSRFPDVPATVLVVLGGSQAVYLGGKAQALYWGRLRDLADLLRRRP